MGPALLAVTNCALGITLLFRPPRSWRWRSSRRWTSPWGLSPARPAALLRKRRV